MLNNALQLPT